MAQLQDSPDVSLPELKPNRMLFSFENGFLDVGHMDGIKFISYYKVRVPETEYEVQFSARDDCKCVAKYHNCVIDEHWLEGDERDIPTPALDKILNYQGQVFPFSLVDGLR